MAIRNTWMIGPFMSHSWAIHEPFMSHSWQMMRGCNYYFLFFCTNNGRHSAISRHIGSIHKGIMRYAPTHGNYDVSAPGWQPKEGKNMTCRMILYWFVSESDHRDKKIYRKEALRVMRQWVLTRCICEGSYIVIYRLYYYHILKMCILCMRCIRYAPKVHANKGHIESYRII